MPDTGQDDSIKPNVPGAALLKFAGYAARTQVSPYRAWRMRSASGALERPAAPGDLVRYSHLTPPCSCSCSCDPAKRPGQLDAAPDPAS
jgi:hypothetical protein